MPIEDDLPLTRDAPAAERLRARREIVSDPVPACEAHSHALLERRIRERLAAIPTPDAIC